jgi:hypothetical protein
VDFFFCGSLVVAEVLAGIIGRRIALADRRKAGRRRRP